MVLRFGLLVQDLLEGRLPEVLQDCLKGCEYVACAQGRACVEAAAQLANANHQIACTAPLH